MSVAFASVAVEQFLSPEANVQNAALEIYKKTSKKFARGIIKKEIIPLEIFIFNNNERQNWAPPPLTISKTDCE